MKLIQAPSRLAKRELDLQIEPANRFERWVEAPTAARGVISGSRPG